MKELLVYNFSEIEPEYNSFFAYVNPEENDRWAIGWNDGGYIREEGTGYKFNPEQLTIWHPLPGINGIPVFEKNNH